MALSSSEQNAASTPCGKYRYVVSMQHVSRAVAARLVRPRLLLVLLLLVLLLLLLLLLLMVVVMIR